MLAGSSYAVIDQESIIAIWLMDENDEDIAIDSSRNGNDGQLINGAKWGEGKIGYCLRQHEN